jgi:hypothetical protein
MSYTKSVIKYFVIYIVIFASAYSGARYAFGLKPLGAYTPFSTLQSQFQTKITGTGLLRVTASTVSTTTLEVSDTMALNETLLNTATDKSTMSTGTSTIVWSVDKTCVITRFVTKVDATTGSNVSTQPIISFGTNAAGTPFSNLVSATTYAYPTVVSSINKLAVHAVNYSSGAGALVSSGDTIRASITQATAGPSTHTITIYTFGYCL